MKTTLLSLKTWITSKWPEILTALILTGTVIGTIGLIGLAIILVASVALASIGWYFATIKSKKRNIGQIFSSSANFFFLIALAIDHLGNVIGGGFLNWLLLKELSPFPFGNAGESASEIIGWNYKIENLNNRGEILRTSLDYIDRNHCEKARKKAVDKAHDLLHKYKAYQSRVETIENTKAFMAKYN